MQTTVLKGLHRLNPYKSDMAVHHSGRIILRSGLCERMGLDKDSRVSFYVDNENNLYVCKDKNGLKPTMQHGRRYCRLYSAETARKILSLPDVPECLQEAAFRVGEPEEGSMFPVITRIVL